VICLPSFVKILLKPVDDPPFLQTICAIIVNVLLPSNTNSKNPEYLDLGKEVFSLLDAITYSLPAEYQSQLSHVIRLLFHLALQACRLAVIPQTADVLTMMLSKDQSPSFLENSARTLSYLSTRVLSRTEHGPHCTLTPSQEPAFSVLCCRSRRTHQKAAEISSNYRRWTECALC
jgi:hypothetical protein